MQRFSKIFGMIAAVQVAIVLGSKLGAVLRNLLTGDQAQGGEFYYKDEQGHELRTIPPVTHSLPGMAFAILGRKQPWLWGFIGSFITSVLLGDRLEKKFALALAERIKPMENARSDVAQPA
jgi:hypothetical protein